MLVTWFEKVEDALNGGVIVRREEADSPNLAMQQHTIAELLRAAGLFLPAVANKSARSVELKLERKFLDSELTVYEHRQEIMAEDNYEFVPSNPCDVEVVEWETHGLEELTNLALARRLHLQDGIDMWQAFESMSQDGLVAALGGVPGGGRGGGRGGGARGRGKGRRGRG